MKVTLIEGGCVGDYDLPDFSIDGVIDHLNISREDLEKAKADGYVESTEMIEETFTENHHVITYFNFNGDATFFVKNR